MDKIIEKISSYHIFNNLVPGYLFLIISSQIMKKNLIIDSLIYSFFEAYFIGIIISRISSLVIEKIIVKIWNLKKEPYDKYIEANKKDDKLEILVLSIYCGGCIAMNVISYIRNCRIFP